MDVVIGFDDNLGLPSEFSNISKLVTRSYHDIGKMVDDFVAEQLAAIFIPCGTLPYINSSYDIVAQATFSTQRSCDLTSIFCSNRPIEISEIPYIVLGHVNQYCTTSFWAPLIYLKNYLKENTTLKFKNNNSFQDMLLQVAAKKIDAAMVWDIILEQNPAATKQVIQTFRLHQLPTPIIIANSLLPNSVIDILNRFKTNDKTSFFTGFTTPDFDAIHQFQQAMQSAANYFNVVTLTEKDYSSST